MIRFLKDDGTSYPEWRKIKISELIEEYSEKVKGTSELPVLTSSTKGIKYQAEHFSKEQNHNIDGYNVIPKGYCTYRNRSDTDRFFFNTNTICDKGIVSKFYPVFKIVGCLSDFLILYLNSSRETKRVISYTAVGTSQNVLSFNDFKNIIVEIPCKEEQEKIANFFSDIDVVIMASEQELAKLEEQKRGVMQKIFSQEVQFKSDEGLNFPEWNTMKFGDVIKEFSVKTVKEDETTLLSCAINGIFLNSELFDHQRGSSNIGYRKIKRGTLILSAQNLHLGNANVNTKFDEGMVSPAYKTFNIIGCEIEFMKHWIKREETKQFFYNATTVGASVCRRNVDWGALYKQTLKLPCKEEQQAIASFLSEFDTAIELAKQELEYWKELKKGLLQQMFV